jgi:putative FmdB family regulatory protein
MKYEYRCADCNNEYEVEKSVTDTSIQHCPECNSHRQVKKITLPNVVFKGTGFTKQRIN